MFSRMATIKGFCTHHASSNTTGTAKAGIQAKGPPTMAINKINTRTKGKSASTTKDADEKKSRSASKSFIELEKMPIDCGLCSKRIDMISRSSVALIAKSARLPPKSTKRALSQRITYSSTAATSVPMANVQSEAYACVGTTRSYTFIVKNTLASANMLATTVANMDST